MEIFDAQDLQVYGGTLEEKVPSDEESAHGGNGDDDIVLANEGSTDGETGSIGGNCASLTQRQSDVIAGGRQSARRKSEQLVVVDGVSPQVHLRVALIGSSLLRRRAFDRISEARPRWPQLVTW